MMNSGIKVLALAMGMVAVGGMALAETAAAKSELATEYEAIYRSGLQTMYSLQGMSQEKIDAKIETKTQAEMKRFNALSPVAQTNKLALARKVQSTVSTNTTEVLKLKQNLQNLKSKLKNNQQLKDSLNSASDAAAGVVIESLLK